MKTVKILRGIPGAGKSTLAKQIFTEQGLKGRPALTFSTFSADYHFEQNGQYCFDGSKLGEAHGQCLRKFTLRLIEYWPHDEILIVDNTNLTMLEMIPYVRLAQAFGVPFEIVTIDCLPEIAAGRNIHGCPPSKVYEMHRRLKDARIPRDWPHIVMDSDIPR